MKRLSFLFQFVFIMPLITAIHLLASVVLWYRRLCSLRNVGVEPLPASLDSEEHALRDISNFVGAGAPNSGTNYSSVIDVSEQYLRVELKRRDNTRAVEILSRSFVAEESDLQVIQTLVACPTWTNAQFVFSSNPDFDTTIFGIFSLLRSSPSLSTLEIALDHSYHKLLSTLLCENPFLETLTLNPPLTPVHYEEPCYCTCMHPLKHSHNCASSECLQELVGVFVPDSSGRQAANTHLTTLKLEPPVYCSLEHNMKALSRMLGVNTTLKHVEVVFGGVNPRIVWEVRSSKPVHCTHMKVCTQEILEVMIGNELRMNASLLSLVVGAWTLRRAGGEWQMSYGGPCQARKVQTREYGVKVKICQ